MKICVFGNKLSTRNLIDYLFRKKIQISYLVILNKSSAKKIEISGADKNLIYKAAEKNIKIYNAKSYSLKNIADASFFINEQFDLGLCTGWQRIIPKDILKTFKFGVFGWHGSGFEFPNGRGRSPLNWSIRLGLHKIYHNCFRYNEGIDSGDIFETKEIEIKESDYIEDIQKKANEHILNSSTRLIYDLINTKLKLYPQTKYPYIAFPSLNEKSGQIYQDQMNCKQAMQIIRSCSIPFPGAYLIFNSNKYRIWKASYCDIKKNKFDINNNFFIKENILYFKLNDGFLKSLNFEIQKL